MGNVFHSKDIAVYGAYAEDLSALMRSSSGGIASALAAKAVARGGYVAGVAYSPDFRSAEYVLTKEKEQLEAFKGAKYIHAKKDHIFSAVREKLLAEQYVLFIGLPCTVAALYAFLGDRPENLLTCELVCHGPTDTRVHEQYIDYLENTYQSKITEFSVRYKKENSRTSYIRAGFENGQVFEEPFYHTQYGYAFSVLGLNTCYSCKYKGDARCADIMLGDFWGAEKRDPFWNPNGVSVVFAETKKGQQALLELEGVRLFPTTFQRAVEQNRAVVCPGKKHPRRDFLMELLEKEGLISAVAKTKTPKEKAVAQIKEWVPEALMAWIRRVYFSLR